MTKTEPVITVAAIQAVVAALLALLVVFGVKLTDAQTAAILGIYAAAAPVLFAIFTRTKVTPAP